MSASSGSVFALAPPSLARQVRQRKQPVQQRSKATVSAVLEGAIQVLLKAGVAGLTTTKVAARAGVSVGTLYQYFPDKASLLMALKVQYAEATVGRVAAAASALGGQPLEVAIPAVIRGALEAKRDGLTLLLALREALSAPTADAVMKEANRAVRAVVQAVLEAAVPGLEGAAMKARMLVSAVEGPVSRAVLEEPRLLVDPAFEVELCALAMGYARTFTAR
jgi:AcrR family transcriptional regulator